MLSLAAPKRQIGSALVPEKKRCLSRPVGQDPPQTPANKLIGNGRLWFPAR